jgi:hypothetical protein
MLGNRSGLKESSCRIFNSILEVSPLPEEIQLQAGDRIKLSALGAERCPRLAGKTGTVIRRRLYSSIVTVRLDGNRTPTSLNRDYIELIEIQP